MMILRGGVTLFPYYDLGGLWKISNENDISKGRGATIFFLHPPHSCSPHSHSPHTCSPHSHTLQELKDDLLDDTAWPVVMQWFNEDH